MGRIANPLAQAFVGSNPTAAFLPVPDAARGRAQKGATPRRLAGAPRTLGRPYPDGGQGQPWLKRAWKQPKSAIVSEPL